ncbi:hypothetical protein VNO77_02820 [Canavalia gladiata]|uniref:Uncharacterized protein n=1 Tax=Canavalia gladiata TaxID=3824 RepID=A0AAN9MTM6_CANGL
MTPSSKPTQTLVGERRDILFAISSGESDAVPLFKLPHMTKQQFRNSLRDQRVHAERIQFHRLNKSRTRIKGIDCVIEDDRKELTFSRVPARFNRDSFASISFDRIRPPTAVFLSLLTIFQPRFWVQVLFL